MQRANLDMVQAIAAFLSGAEAERVEWARPEARKLLELLTETAEDEAVCEEAKTILERTSS